MWLSILKPMDLFNMDILKYKNYEGSGSIDMARLICRGKILFINDLVTYEASSPAELQKEFEAAVDDYIETCRELKIDPQKPLKGQFNVRVPVELHKAAYLKAIEENSSLNDIVVRALQSFLFTHADVNHNVTVRFAMNEGQLKTMISSSSAEPVWGVFQHVH